MLLVLLDFAVILLPFAFAVAGTVMAYRQPDPKHHRIWTWAIIIAGVCGSGVTFLQQQRSAADHLREQSRLNDAFLGTQRQLMYMTGKMDTMSVVMGAIATKPADGSEIAKALARFSGGRQPAATDAQRREAVHAELGKLIGEGERLADGCYSRKTIPDSLVDNTVDWQARSRAAVGGGLDPAHLLELDHTPAENRTIPSRFCEELRAAVNGLRTITWKEFSNKK
jgi:hypothetical protein